ncbi:unnamed protein product [Leptidea sinapis]|uniref:Right handed beta helix domain-containing protein n=1 Tax=Leptidea sinapis TaxID=189913 RepID=A0A5E4PZ72_9NEOP|nr:unnamed protein product [Leptidea sinapis]
MSRHPALFVLLVLVAVTCAYPVYTELRPNMCKRSFCECTPEKHPSWITINCTVPHDQKVSIYEGDLPDTMTSLVISGAEGVVINTNSLTRLSDARYIRITNTKTVVVKKFAAMEMNIVNLFLDISECDSLTIEKRSFVDIKGPLSVAIEECQQVSIDTEAFSWLLSITIVNVTQLRLHEGTFVLDPSASNVGEHGPGMTIKMKNLEVPEFSRQTFGSSAALISMERVNVGTVRPDAFSANTYNIVMAMNCSFHLVERDSFTQNSLINSLSFNSCKIHHLKSGALRSGISKLKILFTRINRVDTGAINATIASIEISNCSFHLFKERGFELSSWNQLHMIGNSFDELSPYAISGPSGSVHEVIFQENEIEDLKEGGLDILGKAYIKYGSLIIYKKNFYGQPCYCNMSRYIENGLSINDSEPFENETYCTINLFFARCFNIYDQNMSFGKFSHNVCSKSNVVECKSFRSVAGSADPEIKNPRFPHKKDDYDEPGLSVRNKKVIAIVIITVFGCILIAMLISLIKLLRQTGCCLNFKEIFRAPCGICRRLCVCNDGGIDNAVSISQLSVHEYSERHRLNEPRIQEVAQEVTQEATQEATQQATQETALNSPIKTQEIVLYDNKTIQTMPEELTKELLDNLKERLDDPENYVEAREMIEHLYELIKVEENSIASGPKIVKIEENIYELPFQDSSPRMGRNNKLMISVGTRTPSLDKLTPLSPYNRHPALLHEYFDPKDIAVHLYAEIVNNDKDKKAVLSSMPDVIAEQAIPRGPYLRAVHEKMSSSAPVSPQKFLNNPLKTSTIKSNKSTSSNSSGKMINRPLPERPVAVSIDPGEGTSFRSG